MGFTAWGPAATPGLVAATPYPTGYVLINGTGNIPGLTWTAPNDGKQHRVLAYMILHVTSAETGGALTLTFTGPDGGVANVAIFAANGGAGFHPITNGPCFIVQAGSTVTVAQTSALTAGAATLFAELWAS